MTKKNENLASTKNMFDSVDVEPTYLFENSDDSLESISNNISLKVEIIENYDPVIFINEETEKLTTIAESIAANFFLIGKIKIQKNVNYVEQLINYDNALIKSFYKNIQVAVLIEDVHYLETENINLLVILAIATETKLVMTASNSIPCLDRRVKELHFDSEEDISAYEMLVNDSLEEKKYFRKRAPKEDFSTWE